jgi:DNA-binding CsgD family transcriptional regulator
MTSPRRSRIGRPYRRLRRWARHTPTGTIALNMIATGLTLILVAVVIAVTAF